MRNIQPTAKWHFVVESLNWTTTTHPRLGEVTMFTLSLGSDIRLTHSYPLQTASIRLWGSQVLFSFYFCVTIGFDLIWRQSWATSNHFFCIYFIIYIIEIYFNKRWIVKSHFIAGTLNPHYFEMTAIDSHAFDQTAVPDCDGQTTRLPNTYGVNMDTDGR